MIEQSCDNIHDSVKNHNLEEVPHIIDDLETVIVSSIGTLKLNKRNCGKEEVLHLLQEPVDSEVAKEHFEELLDKLIKYHSILCK